MVNKYFLYLFVAQIYCYYIQVEGYKTINKYFDEDIYAKLILAFAIGYKALWT